MRWIRFISLLFLVGLVFSSISIADAQDKKKSKKADNESDLPIDSAKLPGGEFIGVLQSVPGKDRLFLLATQSKELVPSEKGASSGSSGIQSTLQAQRQIIQAQRQVQQARNAQQRQQAMQRMARAQLQVNRALGGGQGTKGIPPGYQVKNIRRDIEFQVSEKVKIRSLLNPEEFDEKGNIKKLSSRDIAKLRGKDSHLPGFESSLDKLEAGQTVRVLLRPTPNKLTPKPQGDKDLSENGETEEKKMQVQTIVILGEGKPLPEGSASKSKKK